MLATSAMIFSSLLIVTGVAKLISPHDVERALTALGLPRLPGAGVVIGLAEVIVGAAALLFQPMLLAQGLLYLLFAGWIGLALKTKAPVASCGCLGKDDTPPTGAHLVLDVLAVGFSIGAAFGDRVVLTADLAGFTQVVVIVVGVFLAYIVLTDGARLVGVRAR